MSETTRATATEGEWAWTPELRRLRYFHGQFLKAQDFRREQQYIRDRLRLRMRHLLGYGVVHGLRIRPWPDPPPAAPEADGAVQTEKTDQADQAGSAGAGAGTGHHPYRAKVRLSAGLGADCDGNEIVVLSRCTIDLWAALPVQERVTLTTRTTLWVGIEYAERDVEPTRIVYDDGCGGPQNCEFGYIEDGFTVRVTSKRPSPDRRCHPHEPCADHVLWLARIDDVDPHRPIHADQVHEEIRRPFGLRVPTVITGINWIHGHTYSWSEVQALLGNKQKDVQAGLRVEFSDDVHTRCLRPGVVDVQVIEGPPGRRYGLYVPAGRFVDVPAQQYTRGFRYRLLENEPVSYGDRVMITVRSAFILDRCCQPVSGTHIGGRVPMLDGDDPSPDFCAVPPSGIGPWTSGGAPGGTFESWFFVEEEQ